LYHKLTIKLKTVEFKIEKNIPAPEGAKPGRPLLYPLDKMDIGDSFIAGEYTRKGMNAMCNIVNGYKRRHALKFVCGKTDDGLIRVWRVE
jgi:hypothetical protein